LAYAREQSYKHTNSFSICSLSHRKWDVVTLKGFEIGSKEIFTTKLKKDLHLVHWISFSREPLVAAT
jgi:hypothetical protein